MDSPFTEILQITFPVFLWKLESWFLELKCMVEAQIESRVAGQILGQVSRPIVSEMPDMADVHTSHQPVRNVGNFISVPHVTPHRLTPSKLVYTDCLCRS